MQPLVGSVALVQGLMVWRTSAAGFAVISRLRRVARAIYFDLWPVRVGTAPPQSLQSCFRVAVAIHCSFTVYFYSRIQRQRSPSRHLWRVGVQRLVDHFIYVAERTINRVTIELRSVKLYGEKKGNCCESRERTMFRLSCSMYGVITLLKTSRTGLFRCSVLTTSIDLSNAGMQYGAYEI